MKLLIPTLFLFSLSFTSFAQKTIPTHQLSPVLTNDHAINQSIKPNDSINPSSALFYEDFANGFSGNNGFGAWTAEGIDYDIWAYDTDGPDGPFASSPVLSSPTSSNGFMIFDCGYDTYLEGNYDNRSGTLKSPVIDLSEHDLIMLSLYQKYRFCCEPSHKLLLEVSEDGGSTFPHQYQMNTGIKVNELVDSKFRVNLSEDLSDKSQIVFKLTWSPEGASSYYWMIDDIVIEEAPVYDLTTQMMFSRNFLTGMTPLKAQTPIAIAEQYNYGTRRLISIVKNFGSSNSVYTEAIITTPSNTIIINNSSTAKTLRPNQIDTFYLDFSPEWEIGNYTIDLTSRVFNVDISEDVTPEDNARQDEFDITENTIAANLNNYTPIRANGNQDQAGNLISAHFFNRFILFEDFELHTMGASFPDPTNGPKITRGIQVAWGIFEPDREGGIDMDSPYCLGSNLYYQNSTHIDSGITEGMIGNHLTSLPFRTVHLDNITGEFSVIDTTYTLKGSPTGTVYFAGIRFPSDGFGYLLDDGKSPNNDQTSFSYGNFREYGMDYFQSKHHYVIELNGSSYNSSIQQNENKPDFHLGQNNPNPFNDGTRITYQLNKPQNNITFYITDITGKQLMALNEGIKGAGQHNIELDGSELNAGIYYYTLVVNGQKLARKMIVTD